MSAPAYFAESISSDLGFWGIRCEHYLDFLIGRCGEVDLETEEEEDEELLEGVQPINSGQVQEEEDYQFFVKRLNGLPKEEPVKPMPVKREWQLMGEFCNTR